ncbi:hypothetical protein M231_04496 [Tremella mesenterica]|uniref:Uncharacterized protein n=1 Tax=Tremella mesenterica TaxID=5217 RepID=A0A4Q1BKT1_TREME|nr:hypothetical protein M231_04496 [Tremella mesenterica]
MTQIDASLLQPLFLFPPTSPMIQSFLSSINAQTPKIDIYPEEMYHTYPTICFSLYYKSSQFPISSSDSPQTSVNILNSQDKSPSDRHYLLDRIDITSLSSHPRKKLGSPPEIILRFPDTSLPLPPSPSLNPQTGYHTRSSSSQIINDHKITSDNVDGTTSSSRFTENKNETSKVPLGTTRPSQLVIDKTTTGRNFVSSLGEPTKKGGGTTWLPIYLEWDRVRLLNPSGETVEVGIMVELNDPRGKDERSGDIWDRAGDWVWESFKVFNAHA